METVTTIFNEIPLVIKGKFEPATNGTMYDSDMSGTPPTNAIFEIETICVSDSEINIAVLFSYYEIEILESLCLIEML